MHVTSINVGQPRLLDGPSFSGETGIFKEPVSGAVRVDTLGIGGDAVLNGKHHGGPDQAVYLYRQEDYDWWSEQLGRRLAPGTFGENLTVAGLPEPDLAVGAVLAFPAADAATGVRLEVTAPRIPCNTLAQRMNDSKFAKAFVRAERPGCYCRVLTPGTLTAGERFELVTDTASPVTIVEIFRAAYRKLTRAELERFLAAPIDVRTRRDYEGQLARLAG